MNLATLIYLILAAIDLSRTAETSDFPFTIDVTTPLDLELAAIRSGDRHRRYYWRRFNLRDRKSSKLYSILGDRASDYDRSVLDEIDPRLAIIGTGGSTANDELKRSRQVDDFREPLRFGKRRLLVVKTSGGGARVQFGKRRPSSSSSIGHHRFLGQFKLIPTTNGQRNPFIRQGRRLWHSKAVKIHQQHQSHALIDAVQKILLQHQHQQQQQSAARIDLDRRDDAAVGNRYLIQLSRMRKFRGRQGGAQV